MVEMETRGVEMKQYRYKEYGGKWENKQGYYPRYKKKTDVYRKKTTYPWRNHQKLIHST
jgi:hypothetical protein